MCLFLFAVFVILLHQILFLCSLYLTLLEDKWCSWTGCEKRSEHPIFPKRTDSGLAWGSVTLLSAISLEPGLPQSSMNKSHCCNYHTWTSQHTKISTQTISWAPIVSRSILFPSLPWGQGIKNFCLYSMLCSYIRHAYWYRPGHLFSSSRQAIFQEEVPQRTRITSKCSQCTCRMLAGVINFEVFLRSRHSMLTR